MSFYSRHIFPLLLDLTLSREEITALRRELLADVHGEVLEIGIGSGLNLPCYPAPVKRITAVDVNPGMRPRAVRRMEKSGVAVDLKILNGEALPFPDARFDAVVVTFTLCSIGNVTAALREMRRVLRAGGRLYVLEHGLSPEPGVARWQRRLNPLQKTLGDGCHLDRDVDALVVGAGFSWVSHRSFYLPGIPKTHGWFFWGVGRKS